MSNVSPTNKAYWRKRFEILEQSSNAYAKQAIRKIDPAFAEAERKIDAEITAWYQRFADNNEITMQEARKLLNSKELAELKWDVETYIQYGEKNALDGLWMKELENASAKFHISRLEALKLRTQQAAEVAFGNELDEVDSLARKVLTEGYYHTAFELQKGVGVGWDIGTIDNRKLEKLLTTPWTTDGKTFSDRIWTSKQQLIGEVHNSLTRTCILGKAPDDAIKTISKKFGVSKSQAGRLVMTEQAYFHSVSQKEAFADLGVEQFEIVATLDSHTSEICQDMDGQHFDMKDYEPGVTAPPFHPWCRSVTCPYFDDDFGSVGERAARDEETGKTYYVPANVKYPEWKKAFVDGDSKDIFTPASPGDIIKAAGTIAAIKSASDASTFDELKEYFRNTYNISMDDAVRNLEFSSVKDSLIGFESVVQEYPEMGDLVQDIVTLNSGVMSCTGKQISFNPTYYSVGNNLSDKCFMASQTGDWIKNCSVKSLGSHEAGHGVEWLLIQSNPSYGYDFERTMAWNHCTEAKEIVQEAVRNIKKTAYGKGKRKADLIRTISRYALDNDSETLAEAFQDVFANGDNANPLSVEIKRLVADKLKKYKGVI